MASAVRKLSVTMPVTGVHHCPAEFGSVCCANCEGSLGLSQPDSDQPARLVGVCELCGRWYVLDWLSGFSEGLMILLPDHAELLKMFASHRPPGTRAVGDPGDDGEGCEG